ncbi:MAG TPA: hypothetical protein DCL86_01195 [Bacteroidales bacterium]|jgi:hypothetical protein|nr:hypothetical protein [Bacteroidales bacterium]
MKPASISTLRKELDLLPPKELSHLCLRLAKFSKENKELLSYLIFDAGDEETFIKNVKVLIKAQFEEINTSHMFYVRKSIRKILRTTNKYIRYSGQKQTEAELLIFFCQTLKASGIRYQRVTSLNNLYQNQLIKIQKALALLHEDLQFDYQQELELL